MIDDIMGALVSGYLDGGRVWIPRFRVDEPRIGWGARSLVDTSTIPVLALVLAGRPPSNEPHSGYAGVNSTTGPPPISTRPPPINTGESVVR